MRVGAPVLVREAIVADADAVGEVHAEAWRAGHRDVFEADWLRRLAEQRRTLWSSVMTSREFARNTLLVAERGHRVAAFAYCGPHSDRGPGGEVFDLYAHPTVWSHGVAWTLLDATLESLRDTGFRRVRLWTMAGANRARHFYTSYGFTETTRRREHDFGDGRPVLEIEYERRLR